ncbi:hypothetical protein OKW41_003744 [Paraburkholderia sp. UCT70]
MKPPETLAERREVGRHARKNTPRSAHSDIGNIHRDPIRVLRESSRGRVESLVPLRCGRMLASPFTFYRGSAIIQAHDLAKTANSGFHFQICGDCHLMHFGGFATPERALVFDINDFDETAIGPWTPTWRPTSSPGRARRGACQRGPVVQAPSASPTTPNSAVVFT